MNVFRFILTKVLFAFFVFVSFFANAQSTAFSGQYSFNSTVSAIIEDNNGNTYIGGSFSSIRYYMGKGGLLDANGIHNVSFPVINGTVLCVIPIPSGGWYVGGEFSLVGGVSRSRIARINADGTLHPFNPNVNNIVRALALDYSGNLFVGGDFNSVNGLNRRYICQFNDTGALTGFAPSIFAVQNINVVSVLKFDGAGNLYVGGAFNTVNSISRGNICKFSSTGALMSFPQTNGSVTSIVIDSRGNFYVAGGFSSVDGSPRNNMFKTDSNGVLSSSFVPNFNQAIYSLAIDANDNLYVGGAFTSVNGLLRYRLCKFDSNDALTAYSPNMGDTVRGLTIDSNGDVFVFGDFVTLGNNITRNYACKFTSSGVLTSFHPDFDGSCRALAVSNNGSIFVGGEFNALGPTLIRNGLCKLDPSGIMTSFAPNIGGSVWALAIDNANRLYVGGSITSINGNSISNLCRFDNAGIFDGFAPYFDSYIYALFNDRNGNILVGGNFTSVSVQLNRTQRNRLCEFDRYGNLTSFNPNIQEGFVLTMVEDNLGNLFIGGSFNRVGGPIGPIRSKLCKYDANRNLTTFNPGFTSSVTKLAFDNNQNLYISGAFTSASGILRSKVCKFSSAGVLSPFNPPSLNGIVQDLVVDRDGGVYVAGEFTSVGGNVARDRLCKFDSTGALTSFNPVTGYNRVEVIYLNNSGTSLKVGGNFTGGYLDFNRICPSPATINSTSQILTCANNSISLSAPTASTYLWSNGQSSQNIQVSSAGAYRVTLSYSNGCTSTGSVTVSSNIPPLPNVSVSLNQTVTNVSFPAVITVSGFNTSLYSYRLLNFATNAFIANITSPTIVISYGGVFKIEARSLSNGCVSYSGRIKIVHDPNFGFTIVGVPNPINERTVRPKIAYTHEGDSLSGFKANVNVYPNPTSDLLFVKFKFEEDVETHFVLSSQDGHIMFENVKSTAADFFEVDISEYPLGFYYLHIVNDKASKVIPIQVVRH